VNALLDASSILVAVRRYGARARELLRGAYTIELARYEVGNALWKESSLIGLMSSEEARLVLKAVQRLLEVMNVVAPGDPVLVLIVAQELRVTYYDSAYLTAALERDLVLVTEDTRLARKVGVGAERLRELLGVEPRVVSLKEFLEGSSSR